MKIPLSLLVAGALTVPLSLWRGSGRGATSRLGRTDTLQAFSAQERAVKAYCRSLSEAKSFNTIALLDRPNLMHLSEASIHLKPYSLLAASSTTTLATTAEPVSKNIAFSPAQALATYPRMLVWGDAGAGKTTLLKALALQSASVESESSSLPDLPVYVDLANFRRTGQADLLSYAFSTLGTTLEFFSEYLEERLQNGRILLLFDGLDEADATGSYTYSLNQIAKIAAKYPKTPIVVTCRRAGWHGGLPGFQEMQLLEFGWEDIQDFIGAWFAGQPDMYRGLVKSLLQDVGMRSLAATPFLLALICLIYERQRALPERRADLYTQCVDAVLESWEAAQPTEYRQFTLDHKRALLRKIALYFHKKRLRDFPRQELLAMLTPFLPEIGLPQEATAIVLKLLLDPNGLFVEQSDGLYGFAHLTMQEFFAAEALNADQDYISMKAHLFDTWWREVLVLIAGMDSASVLFRMLANEREKPDEALALACRCMAARPIASQEMQDELNGILARAMQIILDPMAAPLFKAEIIERLAQAKTTATVSFLKQFFDQPWIMNFIDANHYADLLLTLVQMEHPPAYKVAFDWLRNELVDSDLKQRLMDALVMVNERQVILRGLQGSLNYLKGDVRAKAVLLLLRNKDFSRLNDSIALLSTSQIDPQLQLRLLTTLTRVAPLNEIAKPLLDLVGNDLQTGKVALRLKMVDYLVQAGGAEMVARLLGLIRSKTATLHPQIQCRVLLVASRYAQPDSLGQIVGLLDNAPDERVKEFALAAIVVLLEAPYTPVVLEYLEQAAPDNSYNQDLALLLLNLRQDAPARRVAARFIKTLAESEARTTALTDPRQSQQALAKVKEQQQTRLARLREWGRKVSDYAPSFAPTGDAQHDYYMSLYDIR